MRLLQRDFIPIELPSNVDAKGFPLKAIGFPVRPSRDAEGSTCGVFSVTPGRARRAARIETVIAFGSFLHTIQSFGLGIVGLFQ